MAAQGPPRIGSQRLADLAKTAGLDARALGGSAKADAGYTVQSVTLPRSCWSPSCIIAAAGRPGLALPGGSDFSFVIALS